MLARRLRSVFLLGLILMVLGAGACTRSASTPPPSSGTQAATPGSFTQATMEAARAAFMTQTAQATSGVLGPSSTPTVVTPTPVVVVGSPTSASSPTPPAGLTPFPTFTRPPAGGTVDYTIQEGDWLYGIANKFGVDPQQIIELNNLTPPYSLAIGQVLKIPGQGASTPVPPIGTPAGTQVVSGTKYTVQEGEWVYSIARKFGVDPYAIIQANNLQSPYTLLPGQVLVIP